MISIIANGRPKDVADGCTVADLLESIGLDAARTLVELDGEPLERGRFADTLLAAGARVEVAQMVGGG